MAETAVVFAALLAAALSVFLQVEGLLRWPLLLALAVAQGLWLDRLYVTAHDPLQALPRPSPPQRLDGRSLDGAGHGALHRLPLGARLPPRGEPARPGERRPGPFPRQCAHSRRAQLYGRAVWLFYVFGAGFFLHSVATVALFLFAPNRWAERIDPVFANWRWKLRARSAFEFGAGFALHAAVVGLWGWAAWAAVLGLPLLVFAWVWSLLLYVYHYAAEVGPDVRRNVRSLPRQPFVSWLLLNLNEHATEPGTGCARLPSPAG